MPLLDRCRKKEKFSFKLLLKNVFEQLNLFGGIPMTRERDGNRERERNKRETI